MTDKELLTYAAKAAGLDVAWHCPDDDVDEHADYLAGNEGMWLKGSRTPDNNAYWNPLRNDGDAFRLAVRLNLSTQSYPGWDRAQAWYPGTPESAPGEMHNGDPYAAMRRAVTRAAAQIGKSMP